jgi:hypothetical protein
MGSVPVKYDFKVARDRILFLTQLYRVGRKLCPDDDEWGWDIMAQIEDLEGEIAEAHALGQRKKMTTVVSSGHPVIHTENIINPIVQAWSQGSKEDPYAAYSTPSL